MLAMVAAPAAAQETEADPQAPGIQEAPAEDDQTPDDIIVMGIRQNLESAQARKRNADTVVDSLTADEIGSFPDKSVAEALQRVAGITVSRFAGTDDTSHFSAEPSGVIVRGLPQVRSEFNGRDTFSANSSRGLSYSDISPELLAGVDTYKNQTAELIEGGIAGTINLRTRLPFDQKDLFSVSADLSYGDIAEEATPAFSGIFSKRFETDMGEFGVMLNGAYSQVKTGSQGVQFNRMGIFDLPEGTDAEGNTTYVFGPGQQYIPSGIWMRDNLYDRKRYGISAAAQWRSNDGGKELSLQYNRSQYDNSWRERSVYSSAFDLFGLPTDYVVTDPTLIAPLTGTDPFTFDDEGNFLTGWWSPIRPYVGEGDANLGLGVNEDGEAFFNRCYTWETTCTQGQRRAPQIDAASNALRNKQYTQDIGANFRWDVSDRLGLRFDVQYVTSEVKNYNASVTTRTFANTYVDLSGEYPRLEIVPDVGENINLSSGGIANPNNYHYYAVTDHTEDSEGEEIALRLDTDYEFDSDWLHSLRMGVRYADRDQEVKWGAYNWANIANNWTYTQASYFNIDRPIYPSGSYETAGFSDDFFAGNQLNVNDFVFFNMDRLENREDLAAALGRPSIGVGEYYPICSGQGNPGRAGESVTDEFGCYLPSEVLRISERTMATYAMLKFGGPNARMGDIGISGNIGIRLVWTREKTDGSFTFPSAFDSAALSCQRGEDPDGNPTATAGCVTGPDEIAFNDGTVIPGRVRVEHFNALPSFNLKLDLTDKLVSRFAYSRAMSRPDLGLLRNYETVSRVAPNLADRNNPLITYNDAGEAIAYDFQYTGRAGNPYLKPIVADQFDLTLEYYFNASGSLTGTVFYKNFKNYIQLGTYNLTVTNNGVTRDVLMQRPDNGDGAKIKGVEVAFSTFFNFLPSPLDGFGVQANYTYVDNDGIETINLVSETAAGTAGNGVSYDTTAVKANALEGISDHSFNLIGMYEKGRLSVRAAYNWRSEYLVTAVDCCVGLPMWQDSAGFFDASIRYRVTDWMELSVQGSNLLGTDTVLKQQIDSDGTLKPASWFKNDRRVQAGIRVTL
ncbi:TonB-dependent receptor [Sphingomonas gilva]|nr:TonB-dependent receptor [Sphingomonas gilva]